MTLDENTKTFIIYIITLMSEIFIYPFLET